MDTTKRHDRIVMSYARAKLLTKNTRRVMLDLLDNGPIAVADRPARARAIGLSERAFTRAFGALRGNRLASVTEHGDWVLAPEVSAAARERRTA